MKLQSVQTCFASVDTRSRDSVANCHF